jgi:hypothetical protein
VLEIDAEVVKDYEQMLEGVCAVDKVLGLISLSPHTFWKRLGGYLAAWCALGG